MRRARVGVAAEIFQAGQGEGMKSTNNIKRALLTHPWLDAKHYRKGK